MARHKLALGSMRWAAMSGRGGWWSPHAGPHWGQVEGADSTRCIGNTVFAGTVAAAWGVGLQLERQPIVQGMASPKLPRQETQMICLSEYFLIDSLGHLLHSL